MATFHGKDTLAVFVDEDVSADIHNVNATYSADVAEHTTYADDEKVFTPGLIDGTLTLDFRYGLIDNTSTLDALGSNKGAVVAFGTGAAFGVGDRGPVAYGPVTANNPTAPVGGIVDASYTIQGCQPGVVLITGAKSAGENGASVDLVGSGTEWAADGGCLFVAVVTAVTASSFTLKVQHSTNDSVWVDLVDLGTLSAVGSYAGRANGQVRRYVRTVLGGSGTSITLTAAAAPIQT